MSFEGHMTIGGKPVTADEWVTVPNPAHLSTVVGRFPSGTAAHAAMAVDAASAAFPRLAGNAGGRASGVADQGRRLLAKPPSEWVAC